MAICGYYCFNPRARVGRDVSGAKALGGAALGFNPRARVGRDLYMLYYNGCKTSFNPRARVGRDI